jgi:hypothetical protein
MHVCKSFFYRLGLLATLLSLSSCMTENSEKKEQIKGSRLFAVAAVYGQSGILRSLSLDSLKFGPDSIEVNQDSRVLDIDGSVFVLERFGADNILKYDPIGGQVIYQKHLGDRWNPSDLILWKDQTGFVTLEDHPVLLKYDLEKGSILDSLDISSFSHSGDSGIASSPNAKGMAIKGDLLYIALQRRNKAWQLSGGYSMVLIVKMSTFSIVDSIVAPGKNADELWIAGNNLFLSCPNGIDSLNDGALYKWDLTSKAMTTVITEDKLGGHINSLACDSKAQCAASIYRSWGDVQVRRFNLSTGIADPDFIPGITNAFGGLVIDPATGILYVGERNAKGAGILMFSESGEKIIGPISTGLPPSSLSVVQF